MPVTPGRPSPSVIGDEAELEEILTRPSEALLSFVRSIESPLVILGAGGKMGPTLAALAARAALEAGHPLQVTAVSRFTDERARAWLEARGVRTIACDLLDARAVADLPEARNVAYMAGVKFGTEADPANTWAINVVASMRALERYPGARIVALSTGNVYAKSPVADGGRAEAGPLTPHGEYANSAVGRERIFEFFSRRDSTPVAMLRLFYAVELRYGVLADIARKVFEGQAVSLRTGHFNCIWQGDANEMVLRALALADTPMATRNLCLPEVFSVKSTALELGRIMGREPLFEGEPEPTALLGDARKICGELGAPPTDLATILEWVGLWVMKGGRNLGRPTHFEARDGKY